MRVNPGALSDGARRLDSNGAPPPSHTHPPLANDPASVSAAARLTAASTALATVITGQLQGLAATAALLQDLAGGFEGTEATNVANLRTLTNNAEAPTASGWAPRPPRASDVRPPLAPAGPMPPESVSQAVHGGDPAAGADFIAGWTAVAGSVDAAAEQVRAMAEGLPEVWDSPVATPVVREHLMDYYGALRGSADRARGLSDQAQRHATDAANARAAIPSPQAYTQINQQRAQTFQANMATNGRFAAALEQLNQVKNDMDGRTAAGYSTYYDNTAATTGPQTDADGSAAEGEPGSEPALGPDGVPVGPDGQPLDVDDALTLGEDPLAQGGPPTQAGELASMLPQLIPTVLGAAGGLLGGFVSAVTKAPEALAQAATQAAGAAAQSLSGMTSPPGDLGTIDDAGLSSPDGFDSGLGGGGGGGTSPMSGGESPSLPAVSPSTGPAPIQPTLPTGAAPVGGAPAPAGVGSPMGMPMGMPMGGMAPQGAGQGGNQGTQDGPRRQLAKLPAPNTESVTGRPRRETEPVRSSTGSSENTRAPAAEGGAPPASSGIRVRKLAPLPRSDNDS